jgi:hypothetical protein
MVRFILFFILFYSTVYSQDIYENNCIKCHKDIPVSIDKYFYRYLLKHSSERNVKNAIFQYLRKPDVNTTIMPEAFIKRFGVKHKSKLSNKKLNKAIDIYWEKYKVFGKLK